MSAITDNSVVSARTGLFHRLANRLWSGSVVPVALVTAAIIVIWYGAAIWMNAPFQRDIFERADNTTYSTTDLVRATWSQERPVLPAPHQVIQEINKTVFQTKITSKRSLVFHAKVTLSSTLLGFLMGTLLGISLSVGIIHSRALDKSLMPWIITSQTIPILAVAPMIIVVLNAVGISGLVPKAIISAYLSFFPVAVGMVKGLRSPDPMHLDLMRTYNASRAQVFWKLRWPSALPFLFASMKVAIAISLVGAIVGELPTGAVAGLGARMLTGSYYGQTIQIWSALFVASFLAAVLVGLVGIANNRVRRTMGDGAMTRLQWLLALVSLAALLVALTPALPGSAVAFLSPGWFVLLACGLALVVAARPVGRFRPMPLLLSSALLSTAGALLLFSALAEPAGRGPGFWSLLVSSWLAAWLLVERFSELPDRPGLPGLLQRLAIPIVFGIWLLILWEVIVRGAEVSPVLLPPPSMIWVRITGSVPTLWADFQQTFLKAVIAGYAIGCFSGFAVAVLVDRSGFLKRGLMPIGNLMSALPIVGIAPIMVMWFGFDWQSKAAVVVVMTFFPMLVNSVAGLSATGAIERDLMRTYAAGYWASLVKLRIPAALPFIFNALKINSTLALIGAIVAEFFGTPIVGMGFRISTEVGRMNIDMVWAEIAMAALAGSLFYGLVSLIERTFTFWHPSYRSG